MLVTLGWSSQSQGCSSFSAYFATAQFELFFFDCGRAVRCVLPLGCGRFMHLVVLYGYQGADREAEQRGAHQDPFPGKRVLGWSSG